MQLHQLARRQASQNDLPQLYEIEKRAMRGHVIASFGRWDEAEQRTRFFSSTDPKSVQVLIHDFASIGFLHVMRSVDEIYLHRISILPAFQGCGLGTSIVRELTYDASQSSIPVRLRVFKTNPARKLYRLLGFIEERRSAHHIHMILDT